MSQQYKAAAEVLKIAIASINGILNLPEDEMHRLKITQTLQREADYLLLVTGAGDLTENPGSVLGPAKTIGGKAIGKLPRITERDLKPSDDAVLNLKDQVENALFYFGPASSSAGILANIPDMVIRGVAKKAGLQVTKENPKELTVEFIDQIKEALVAKGLVAEREDLIPEAKLEPIVGMGGVSEVHNVTSEDLNKWEGKQPAPELPAETDVDKEAAEFGINAAKDLYDMIKDVKPGQAEQLKAEEPKQETKADTKKKTGK